MNANATHDDAPEISVPGQHDPVARDAWVVLLVDDEPEIHEITRLVLADTSFSGIPLELHSAYSASEAKTFLESHRDTALMLLDVVMETDDAGLRLVTYVREQIGNTDLQIVLRTGQPGMAPEREVIPGYDINGYFLKTDMVAQKLCSIVISSLRAYKYIKTLRPRQAGVASPQLGVFEGHPRRAIAEEFAKAIETNALHLLAQPQVHLVSGAIAAMELMPNWRRGDRILGPAQLAEEIRDPELRLKFDEWLIRQGCAWAQSWQSLGLPPFRISLPVLTENIWDREILSIVEKHLSRLAVPHDILDLEVPEMALLGERPKARDAVALMQSIGISVTLIDFGLGLLSLPQLQRLLPSRVKIHKSFVRHVAQDRERSAIARSIIALVHTLGLTVIADGIAGEQDLQFFKWESCDIGQGDVLARPLAVADVSAALLSDAASASWSLHLH
jgi:EAL domain-containing protein (putative c-di-GMP-specific phosphodiesterase class I)/CheY-like chemotaxis protein